MLNDEILEKYIQSFFGYGNLNSDYWFVSLEEGGNNSEEDIQKRLNLHLLDYQIRLNLNQLFFHSLTSRVY